MIKQTSANVRLQQSHFVTNRVETFPTLQNLLAYVLSHYHPKDREMFFLVMSFKTN